MTNILGVACLEICAFARKIGRFQWFHGIVKGMVAAEDSGVCFEWVQRESERAGGVSDSEGQGSKAQVGTGPVHLSARVDGRAVNPACGSARGF